MSRKVQLDLERSPVGVGLRKIGQWVSYSDFTDGGAADGTLSLAKSIPAGSFVLGSKVTVTTGFTGDTTAVMNIGTAADDDLFSQTTHNIYTAATNLVEGVDIAAAGAGRGIVAVGTAVAVLLTITGGADFSSISAGRMYVEVIYLSTNPEVIDSVATRYDG